MTIFSPNIAIFYINPKLAMDTYKQMVDDFNRLEILESYHTAAMQIRLKNGSGINFLKADEYSARGRRFHLVFVEQDAIDSTVYPHIIKVVNCLAKNPVYLWESIDDIYYPKKKADDYFYKKYDGKEWKIKLAERQLRSAYFDYYNPVEGID